MPIQSKEELLRHYSRREPHRFLQYDGFSLGPGSLDDVTHPDRQGDAVVSGITDELMSGTCQVRVLVTAGTSQEDTLRLLGKITKAIKKRGLIQLDDDGDRAYLGSSIDEISFF